MLPGGACTSFKRWFWCFAQRSSRSRGILSLEAFLVTWWFRGWVIGPHVGTPRKHSSHSQASSAKNLHLRTLTVQGRESLKIREDGFICIFGTMPKLHRACTYGFLGSKRRDSWSSVYTYVRITSRSVPQRGDYRNGIFADWSVYN